MSTLSHLSIWRHRQQGLICNTTSFMQSFKWVLRWQDIICCWVQRNAWFNHEQVKKVHNWVCTLTRSSLCHLNRRDPQGPDITLQNSQETRSISTLHSLLRTVLTIKECYSYPVVVGGVWVFIAGNDLRCHPVRCANEGVPTPHCPVQLGAHPKINWILTKEDKEKWDIQNNTFREKWPKPVKYLTYQVWPLHSLLATHSAPWYLCGWLYGHGGEKGPGHKTETSTPVV